MSRLAYYRIAYRWARSMDYSPIAAVVLARHGWQKQIFVPVPIDPRDPEAQEMIQLGRELAKRYGW